MQSSTTPPITMTSVISVYTFITVSSKPVLFLEFMAELLYWIAICCTDVPNKLATECVFAVLRLRVEEELP